MAGGLFACGSAGKSSPGSRDSLWSGFNTLPKASEKPISPSIPAAKRDSFTTGANPGTATEAYRKNLPAKITAIENKLATKSAPEQYRSVENPAHESFRRSLGAPLLDSNSVSIPQNSFEPSNPLNLSEASPQNTGAANLGGNAATALPSSKAISSSGAVFARSTSNSSSSGGPTSGTSQISNSNQGVASGAPSFVASTTSFGSAAALGSTFSSKPVLTSRGARPLLVKPLVPLVVIAPVEGAGNSNSTTVASNNSGTGLREGNEGQSTGGMETLKPPPPPPPGSATGTSLKMIVKGDTGGAPQDGAELYANYAPTQDTGVAANDVTVEEPWHLIFLVVFVNSEATLGSSGNPETPIRVNVRGRLVAYDGCPLATSVAGLVFRISEPTRNQAIDVIIQADYSFSTSLEVLPASVDFNKEKPIGWKFFLAPKDFSGPLFATAKICSPEEQNCLQLNKDWHFIIPPLTSALKLTCPQPELNMGAEHLRQEEVDRMFYINKPHSPDPPENEAWKKTILSSPEQLQRYPYLLK